MIFESRPLRQSKAPCNEGLFLSKVRGLHWEMIFELRQSKAPCNEGLFLSKVRGLHWEMIFESRPLRQKSVLHENAMGGLYRQVYARERKLRVVFVIYRKSVFLKRKRISAYKKRPGLFGNQVSLR
ncbi:MAG: hypothetical protein DCC54_11735 [Anaerolineae bacterium]|nr:MAG: hypothetical protein DCC54_11735 [Anaerolineae bacterium]